MLAHLKEYACHPSNNIATFFLRHKRFFALAFLVLFIGVGISAIYRGTVSDPPRSDLPVFMRAAEAVHTGENLYDVKTVRQWNYVYLPLLAVILSPAASIPFPVVVVFWYLLSVACAAATFFLVLNIFPGSEAAFKAAILASLLTIPPLLNTLTRGQFGTIGLFLMVLVFYLSSRGKSVSAGVTLALTITLKTSPAAALVFFFLLKRDWKLLIATAAGFVLFLFLGPALVLGWERNLFLLGEYFRVMSDAVSSHGQGGPLWQQLVTPFAEDNQSLYAVLTRIAWPDESLFRGESNLLIQHGTRLAGICVLSVLAWISKKSGEETGTERGFFEFSLFSMWMIFFSPVTQIHHYIVFFLPLFSGFYLVFRNDSPARLTEVSVWLAFLCFMFGLILDELSFWGLPMWGTLFLCAVLALKLPKPISAAE